MKRVSSSRSRGSSGKGTKGIRGNYGLGYNGFGSFKKSASFRGRIISRRIFGSTPKHDVHNYKDYVGHSRIYPLIGTLIAIAVLAFVFLSVAL